MWNGLIRIDEPDNEPVLSYAPGTAERANVTRALEACAAERKELPCVIDGKAEQCRERMAVRMPHQHDHVLGETHVATPDLVARAVTSALEARKVWTDVAFDERVAVFLSAAELIAGPYRQRINAATMLGQSQTVHQAEIDSACELIDFLRFNAFFARRMLEEQPISFQEIRNNLDYRPLDGFVLAITPFNFTAIAGNLPTAPALMGNTVVWKPAPTQALAAQVFMEILQKAGLPPGVINLVHGPGPELAPALDHPELGAIHFTGSTRTFQALWRHVGQNIQCYRSYPRIVGETGGKDFVLAHPSADVDALAVALVRGAFEYQGQKCSAASRAYIPESLWPALAPRLEAEVNALRVGDVRDFKNFMGAVIDARAYAKIKEYIEYARSSSDADVWLGGECADETGYFVRPTVVLTSNPTHKLMVEEIFGPVLTIYRYADKDFDDVLRLVDTSTPYALTGAVFGQDRIAAHRAVASLRFAAGNVYINDKPTGAVVGRQPFGGGRASGTNDKAGSMWNLMRWVSPRAIKENLAPPTQVGYPFMG